MIGHIFIGEYWYGRSRQYHATAKEIGNHYGMRESKDKLLTVVLTRCVKWQDGDIAHCIAKTWYTYTVDFSRIAYELTSKFPLILACLLLNLRCQTSLKLLSPLLKIIISV